MKVSLKPKFYKHEMDNPFIGKDDTKAIFWKWEQLVFGPAGENSTLLEDYLLRGIRIMMGINVKPGTPDDIPSEIKEATAPLEEKAFVAQMYSNELGTNRMLQDDPSQIRWTDYFKD